MRDLSDTVRRISGGPEHTVLQDRPGRFVVRLPNRGDGPTVIKFDVRPERSAREGAVLSHFAEGPAARLVPRVLRQGLLPDGVAFLQTEAIDSLPGRDPAGRRPAVGARLRTLHRALEGLPADTVPSLLTPPCVRDFTTVQAGLLIARGELPVAPVRRLLERLDALPAAAAVVHGDLKSEHVLHSSTGARFIDWADVRVADPMWDVAVLTLDSPEETEEVLRGYGTGRACDVESVAAHRLVRAISDVTWAQRAGRPTSGLLARLRRLLHTTEGRTP